MHGFIDIWFQSLNFLIILAIFIILSLIFIKSRKKYDIIASTLFLKRNKIRTTIYTGYFGVLLLFTGNFLVIFGQTIAEIEILSHLITVTGLYMILFMAIGLFTATNLSETLKKNKTDKVKIVAVDKNNFVHWLVDKIKF